MASRMLVLLNFFRVHLFSCWLLIDMTYGKCNYLKSNPLLLIKLNNFPYTYIVETIYSRKLAHNFDFNITKYKFIYDHLPWLTKMVKLILFIFEFYYIYYVITYILYIFCQGKPIFYVLFLHESIIFNFLKLP